MKPFLTPNPEKAPVSLVHMRSLWRPGSQYPQLISLAGTPNPPLGLHVLTGEERAT